MDQREFLTLLGNYPIVRKRTHCRVQWNSIDDNCSPEEQQTFTDKSNGSVCAEKNFHQSLSFRDATEKYVGDHILPQKIPLFSEMLDQSLSRFIHELCLDDLEIYCAEL